MSLVDTILGTESSAEFKQMDLKTDTQKKALDKLLKMLSGEVEDFDTSPELTERQQNAQTGIDELIANMSGIQGSVKDATTIDQETLNKEFSQGVADPMIREFEEDILPLITRRFGGASFGSERRRTELDAVEDLTQNLTSERAKFNQTARNQQLQALGLVPGITSSFGDAAGFSDLEELRRQQAQKERIQLMNLLLGGTGQNTFENIGIAKPGMGGALQSFLGGLGEGAGSSLIPG